MDSGDHGRRTHRGRSLAAASLAVVAALALAAGASAGTVGRVTLTPAEQVFVKQYKVLIPNLDKASSAVISAVKNAGNDTDAQVVTVFTAVAKQWASATKPLFALSAPSPVASIFATITGEVPRVEADLLAIANTGRTHNGSAATKAGRKIAVDFNALGVAVNQLKKKLGLP
jgi:hypothetical protein